MTEEEKLLALHEAARFFEEALKRATFEMFDTEYNKCEILAAYMAALTHRRTLRTVALQAEPSLLSEIEALENLDTRICISLNWV